MVCVVPPCVPYGLRAVASGAASWPRDPGATVLSRHLLPCQREATSLPNQTSLLGSIHGSASTRAACRGAHTHIGAQAKAAHHASRGAPPATESRAPHVTLRAATLACTGLRSIPGPHTRTRLRPPPPRCSHTGTSSSCRRSRSTHTSVGIKAFMTTNVRLRTLCVGGKQGSLQGPCTYTCRCKARQALHVHMQVQSKAGPARSAT